MTPYTEEQEADIDTSEHALSPHRSGQEAFRATRVCRTEVIKVCWACCWKLDPQGEELDRVKFKDTVKSLGGV